MNRIEVEFVPEFGLIFWRFESNKKLKAHEVKIETLKSMSLTDLEYCLSTNSLMELNGLHSLFSDYLWGSDGKVEPSKQRDEPR